MSTSSSPRIVGLAGTFASGKDTLAQYLVRKHNYLYVSTSDLVRQEALKERGSVERPVLYEVANKLRHEHGAGVLVDLAVKIFEAKLEESDDYKGVVLGGLRSLGEAKAVKANGGVIVFTDAPLETRYQRMVARQRDDETRLTLDEFKVQEAKELTPSGEGDEAFNILGIRDMSDFIITNDTDLDGFLQQAIDKLHLR